MSMLGKPINKTEPIELIHARLGIYITLSALSCLSNFVFLLALWRSWKLVKQRRISYHIANLALSDALVGASTLLHYIAGENELGNAFVIIAWTAILSSMLAIGLMAVERTLAIKVPHRWTSMFPLKKVFVVMLANWCGTLVLAVLMHYYDVVMRFILLVLFYVTIMITSLMYFYIYFKVGKKSQALSDSTPTQVQEKKKRLYQRKVGSFVVLLTAILMLTVSPSFLTLAVKNACVVFEIDCDFMDTITYLSYYFYMLEITNFVINPVIYVWKMKLYRRAIWRLFGKTGTVVSESSAGP